MLIALLKKDTTIEFLDFNKEYYITSEIESIDRQGSFTASPCLLITFKNVKMRDVTPEDLEKDNKISENAVEPSIKGNIKELVEL